jgi:prepilin-type N-terminal cleavage/methylation domain-containing protein
MNCNPNQNSGLRRQEARAFTLIEMIGVLAVIAILASLLIPKVFSAISQARVNGVTISTDTVKTALVDHYGRYGNFDQVFGTNPVPVTFNAGISSGYDTNVLIVEGLLDKPYIAAISTNATIQLCVGGHENGNALNGYMLAGPQQGITTNAQYVLEAKLMGVSQQDAKDLNDRIDGTPLGAPVGVADTVGRVEYQLSGNTATVYIYLTSR